MKNFITIATIALTVASAAYAADDKPTDKQAGMMQGDMMKNCQMHMQDNKMMDSMPKEMMAQCQEMMKDGGMMKGGMMHGGMKGMEHEGAAKPETPKDADDTDHGKHHPAQ